MTHQLARLFQQFVLEEIIDLKALIFKLPASVETIETLETTSSKLFVQLIIIVILEQKIQQGVQLVLYVHQDH